MVNELWRAVVVGVFCQIMFAKNAAEMAYLMFAGAIATESKSACLTLPQPFY